MKKLDIKTEILYDTLGSNKCIVHYPVITSPQSFATISINNFSKFHAENFINITMNEVFPNLTSEPVTSSMYWQLMFSSRFTLSYKYESLTYNKNGECKTLICGAVWNIHTGSAFKLQDFFRPNVRYKEIILYILSGKIKERISKGETFLNGWYGALYSCSSGFYLCKEGFVFIFEEGTLTPGCPCELLISYMELKNQLNLKLIT